MKAQGLDLSGYFLGTLNVDVGPYEFVMQQPVHCFRRVDWWVGIPPEDFSFQVCRVAMGGALYEGLVYSKRPLWITPPITVSEWEIAFGAAF